MDRHRIRFIVGRAHMRTILAGYLGIQPIDLPLCYQQLGKPYLDPHANPRGLQFNFSNSQDGGLLAVAQGRSSIGVDLEELKYHRDFLGLAARYFHPSETLAVQRGSVAEQTESFYRCWTRKEAFLKAIGKGLTFPLRDVVVTCERHESAMIRAIQDDAERAITWCVEHLTPMYGYIGALVYEAPRLTLQQFAWRRPHG
jgi:4'-phosphopantetheinyl transferase